MIFSKNSFSELCALSVPVKKWYGRRSVENSEISPNPFSKRGTDYLPL
jgi:hypothetical protein